MKATPVRFGKLYGKSATDSAGKRVLGPKRMEALKKEAANYNRRIKRRIKKYYGDVNWENANAYIKHNKGVLINLIVSNIKSVKDYKAWMRFLARDKSKDYKIEVRDKKRNRMNDMIEIGYDADPELLSPLFDVINNMSTDEIMRWEVTYKDLMRETFRHYNLHDRLTKDENWLDDMDTLIASIKDITGKDIPSVREMLGIE